MQRRTRGRRGRGEQRGDREGKRDSSEDDDLNQASDKEKGRSTDRGPTRTRAATRRACLGASVSARRLFGARRFLARGGFGRAAVLAPRHTRAARQWRRFHSLSSAARSEHKVPVTELLDIRNHGRSRSHGGKQGSYLRDRRLDHICRELVARWKGGWLKDGRLDHAVLKMPVYEATGSPAEILWNHRSHQGPGCASRNQRRLVEQGPPDDRQSVLQCITDLRGLSKCASTQSPSPRSSICASPSRTRSRISCSTLTWITFRV